VASGEWRNPQRISLATFSTFLRICCQLWQHFSFFPENVANKKKCSAPSTFSAVDNEKE
jgi:hypothetical protein